MTGSRCRFVLVRFSFRTVLVEVQYLYEEHFSTSLRVDNFSLNEYHFNLLSIIQYYTVLYLLVGNVSLYVGTVYCQLQRTVSTVIGMCNAIFAFQNLLIAIFLINYLRTYLSYSLYLRGLRIFYSYCKI